MIDRPSPNMSNNVGRYSYVILRYGELQVHVFEHHAPSGLNAAQPMNVENRVSAFDPSL
jgi:hypothetical protein